MPLESESWLFFTAVVAAPAAVVVITVGCFYSSYPLDIDLCEWNNGVSILLLCFDCFTLFQALSFCQ
jgi:hypothetical protein